MMSHAQAQELAVKLQDGADDPMWADHCEMSKKTAGDAAQALRDLLAENHSLICQQIATSHALANETLRANQLAQQHRMQAGMHAQAAQQLAAMPMLRPLTNTQIAEVVKGEFGAHFPAMEYDVKLTHAVERAHGITERPAMTAQSVACACGDTFPANSYGAGYVDAKGHCQGCDAAQGD